MGIKSALIYPLARARGRKLTRQHAQAVKFQHSVFRKLLQTAKGTIYGTEHRFDAIRTYDDFKRQVPLRDYEGLRRYITRIREGEQDVLWPGMPRYFAKTSGTTSGVKYIPISTESIPNHIISAQNALFNYVSETGNGRFFDGKMIFLSGSPKLTSVNGIPTGRLSGIVNHLVPGWIRGNQLPGEQTNLIEDWEEKVDAIVEETYSQDMRLISGIPPWVQMYYERLLDRSGAASISEMFPNYSLFVYGGVNYAPYADKLRALVGKNVDILETYPASEGFIAFQDRWPSEGLRLNVNSGIFFEFVPLSEIGHPQPERIQLDDVECDVDYAIIINNNAGLWGYDIGDTIRFVSVDPPRIIVSGRVKHFISAFGEHVIAKEVEEAMTLACEKTGISVAEFSVAPQVSPPDNGTPYHEWLVEFAGDIPDLARFSTIIDREMVEQNIYYRDLINGGILRPAVITPVHKGGFRAFMESKGKLGGQNKVARLMNTREVAEALQPFLHTP